MNFIRKALGSNTGVSSKRIIGLAAATSMIVIAFVDLFTNYTVTEYVYDGLKWLAIGGIFGIASERFADIMKATASPQSTNDESEQPVEQNSPE